MRSVIVMAWRNLWRNRRRTLITAGSVVFAVFFAIAMRSIQDGSWDYMVDSVVHIQTGYIQIHKKGYWEDKSIDKAFEEEEVEKVIDLESMESFLGFIPRVEQFALAAVGNKTQGVLVVAIDPQRERAFGDLEKRLTSGKYLDSKSGGILIAEDLSRLLNASIGDTLVLLSQGYRGASAAGLFPIRGILQFGNPQLNKVLTYITIEESQYFLDLNNQVTTLVVDIPGRREVNSIVSTLEEQLPEDFEVIGYETMLPDLMQAKELDKVGAYLIAIILYLIIAFGLFGTMIMMLKEREYEFGVLKAIGMNGNQLFIMVWIEAMFIGLIGVLIGCMIAAPLVYWFNVNPIELTGDMAEAYAQFGVEPVLPSAFYPAIFISQALIVLMLVTIISIYPYFKIRNLNTAEALRA